MARIALRIVSSTADTIVNNSPVAIEENHHRVELSSLLLKEPSSAAMFSDPTNWRLLVSNSAQPINVRRDRPSPSPVFLVVDDYDAVLQCLLPMLKSSYPDATLIAAQDLESAIAHLRQRHIDLAILDLELPQRLGEKPYCGHGVGLLKAAMQAENASSILVLGESIQPLLQMKSEIYRYKAGFVAVEKNKPVRDVMRSVDLALCGSIHLPVEVRSRAQIKEKWIAILRLKYQEGLSDRAIARHLGVCPRTLRGYWPRIQDMLGVYNDPNKDLRIQIEQAARQVGLID